MQQATITYTSARGWNAPIPGHLDSEQTLVLAFGAPTFGADAVPFETLAGSLPRSLMLGCSGAGEIAGNMVNDDSISVAVVRFDHTRLRRALTHMSGSDDSFDAGTRLAQSLAAGDLRAVFVLSDGLCVNGSQLVDSLRQHLPAGVVITGGLAGDGSRFSSTWVLDHARPASACISAVGFYGERLQVGHGCEGGWSDFGPERRITRSKDNVLYELDGKPALALYKTYLGDRAAELPGSALLFPLSVQREEGSAPLVRTILAVDELQQSLTFAGDLPEGGQGRLMRANTDKLIGSAGRAAQQAMSGLPDCADSLALSVSCVGRRLVLGERTEEEVEAVGEQLPDGAGHIGFYSYGEISPLAGSGASELHNQTMTVTVLTER
jgi:hypothetical protein